MLAFVIVMEAPASPNTAPPCQIQCTQSKRINARPCVALRQHRQPTSRAWTSWNTQSVIDAVAPAVAYTAPPKPDVEVPLLWKYVLAAVTVAEAPVTEMQDS